MIPLVALAVGLAPAGQDAPPTEAERAELRKGHVILKEIPSPGKKGRTFQALGILPCGLEEAFAVLTDFGKYQEFMPQVQRAEARSEGPGAAVVDLRLGLPLGMAKSYRLHYEWARSEEGFDITWRMVPWPEVPPEEQIADTSGSWRVRRFEGGGLVATYTCYTDPGKVPLGLTSLAMTLAKKGIPDVIEKTRGRIRSLSAPREK